MSLLTFTADATTDQITSTAHGRVTGDGPFDVLNSGGALPGGLALATPYWFIRIDADHGKLATSQANAIAGTAINITSNGSGTQNLVSSLPTYPTRTFAAGSQIPSADLNEFMAQITGAKHKNRPIIVPGSAFMIDSGAPTRSGQVWTFGSGGTYVLVAPVQLLVGTRITNVVWSFNRNGSTGAFNFKLTKRSFGDGGAGAAADVYSDSVSTGTGWTTHDSASAPYTTEDAMLYLLSVGVPAPSANAFFDGARIFVDRL